jgi:hypothetical protein
MNTRSALKSLVVVCCLSSGLAFARPSVEDRPLGFWAQLERYAVDAPLEALRSFVGMMDLRRAGALHSVRQ